jgi:type VI secretion system protein ImpJ
MPKKPIWTEGLFVSQHHFQQQDRYHESLVRDRLEPLVHYDWGITELTVDDTALSANQFKLRKFRAVWPDGTVIACGDGTDNPVPPPRTFEQVWKSDAPKLEIFVGLPEDSENGATLSNDADTSAFRRYTRVLESPNDTNTGTSPQELEWARPNLRVFFGKERQDGFVTIRVAELVRQASGQPIVRDNYVPPVLRIDAAPFLVTGLQRVLKAMTARQRQLASERKQRQAGTIDFASADARRFWLLHTLNGAISPLTHMLDTLRVHPEETYLLLATLIGQLCTFASDADPVEVPKFNYLELGDVFEPIFARVLSLLSGGIEDRYTEIPLEHRPDGMFIGKIPDPRLVTQEFFVAVKANIAEAIVRERIPAVLKMAGWNHIFEVVKQARHGVRVETEWKPPGALPIKPGLCFFRVRREGPFWDEITKSSTVALYVPTDADWSGATLNLYALDPAYLR